MSQVHPEKKHKEPSIWQREQCFGCGAKNASGLRLKFLPGADGKSYRAEFRLAERFSGPPGHAHGGIIATILDESMAKTNKLRDKVALTRRMEVEYLRPVPLGQPLVAVGWTVRMKGRAIYNRAELRNQHGDVLARSHGKFWTINPEKMFARELGSAAQGEK